MIGLVHVRKIREAIESIDKNAVITNIVLSDFIFETIKDYFDFDDVSNIYSFMGYSVIHYNYLEQDDFLIRTK